jgi:hypothetical protein
MSNPPSFCRPYLWLLFVALCVLAGCSSPPTVTSKRDPAVSDAQLAKGGSVCVLTSMTLQGRYSDPKEAEEDRIASSFFRARGFSIAPKIAGADYAFVAIGKVEPASAVGGSKGKYVHGLKARLFSIGADGRAEKEVWSGTGLWIGSGSDPWGVKNRLLTQTLKRFPN